MKITLSFLLLLACFCAYSQDCKQSYQNFGEGNFSDDVQAEIRTWINNKDELLNKFINEGKKCRLDPTTLTRLYDRWKEVKEPIIERNEARNRNKSDYRRMKDRWELFQSELRFFEGVIFPDPTLATVRKKIDSILDASPPNFNGIGFFKNTYDTNENLKTAIKSFDSLIQRYADKLKSVADTLAKVNTTTNTIKNYLMQRGTTNRLIPFISAFDNSLYSVGGFYVFSKSSIDSLIISPFTLYGEAVFPVNSQNFSSMGGFVSAGVQHRSLIVLAGMGYITNNLERENISWKGTILYSPPKSFVGLGLSYSPLTNVGISVHLNYKNFRR